MTERIGPEAWRTRYLHAQPWDTQFAPQSMPELLAEAVEAHPDRVLSDFLGAELTYMQVAHEARRFAAGLQARGIGSGDRVGLFLPNVPTYLAAYFGAMMAGATVVNFSPLYTSEELSAQVADSGTRLLVTLNVPALLPTALEVLDGSGLETVVVARLEAMLPRIKGWALRLFKRGDLADIPSRDGVLEWSKIVSDAEPSPVAIDPETDLALLQYTGGTTGTPKGAMLTHQNLTAVARQINSIDPEKGARDVILGVLPFFHVFANACVLLRTVVNGGTIAMLPRFDAGQALDTIKRVRPTAMPGVPTMYQALLDHPKMDATDFSSIRSCISGGAPLAAPLKEEFERRAGTRLLEGYGLTETAGVVSTNPYDHGDRAGTIGQPTPGTDVRLIDKEDPDKDVASSEPGEIVINGPQVMAGYWNRPDADGVTFVEREGKRWLRTGDIGEIDPDGFIRIVDRSKDMIAVGGFKVFPSQVEAVMVENPAVKEALVIGVPNDYRGEMPRAFVTLNSDERASAEELCEWLNARVGKHERVDSVVLREELPKTMVGKLDRKALRAELAAEKGV